MMVLLPRLALLIALLPGGYGLWLALGGWPGQATSSQLRLSQQVQSWDLPQMQSAAALAFARREGLWALDVQDRGGSVLLAVSRVPWLPRALLGSPFTVSHQVSGAQVRLWPIRAVRDRALLGLVAVLWSALMLLAWRALGRVPKGSGAALRTQPPNVSAGLSESLKPSLRRLLDTAPCALLTADSRGRVRHANPVACLWLGRSLASLRGQELQQVLRLYRDGEEAPQLPWAQPLAADRPADRWALRVGEQTRVVNLVWATARRGGGLTVALFDVSALDAARQEEISEAALLRHIVNVLPVGVLVTDADNRIQMTNRTAERLFAWAPGELAGETVSKLMPVPFLNQPDIRLQDYRGQQPESGAALPKVVGWRKDATTFPVALTVEDLRDSDGGLLVLVEDQTETLQREAAQSRLGRVFEQTAEEVIILDARSLYVREANRGAQDNLGYDLRQLRRMTLFHLAPDLDALTTEPRLARLRAGEQRELRLNSNFRRADGSAYPIELSLTCSREEEPPVLMLLAHDMTALRAAENRLAWMSRHDSLTRLLNRSAAMEELARIARDPRLQGQAEVLVIGLEAMRQINLRHGHEKGDVLLATIAERLAELFPAAALIARWSGATFLLLLESPAPDLDATLAALTAPLDLDGTTVEPVLGMGLAPVSARYEDALARAAAAMDQSLAAGGGWRRGAQDG